MTDYTHAFNWMLDSAEQSVILKSLWFTIASEVFVTKLGPYRTTAIVTHSHPFAQRRRPLRGLIFEAGWSAWSAVGWPDGGGTLIKRNKNLLFYYSSVSLNPCIEIAWASGLRKGLNFSLLFFSRLEETPDTPASIDIV